MLVQTWAWLIGMSDAGDARLLQWAHSFAKPPALELHGARPASEPYSPERRASRLIVEHHMVTIGIKPAAVCVNPVFELEGAAKELLEHRIGRPRARRQALRVGRQNALDRFDAYPGYPIATTVRQRRVALRL